MNIQTFNKINEMLCNTKHVYAILSRYYQKLTFLTEDEIKYAYRRHHWSLFVKEVNVTSIGVTNNTLGQWFNIHCRCSLNGLYTDDDVPIECIGTTVFFTEEEAIAKRDELMSYVPKYSVDDFIRVIKNENGKYDDGIIQSMTEHISKHKGQLSDGYHTFDELYDHRAALTAALFKSLPSGTVYKSKHHSDGTMYDGMFIVGTELPTGKLISYHYDLDPWWDIFNIREVEYAPKWDGHTPDDVIERLKEYAKSNL